MPAPLNQVITRPSGAKLALLAGSMAAISLAFCAILASADDAVRGGDVELIVRGPDARPLAGARVMITPAPRATDGGQTQELALQSDGEGRIHFHWTPGVVRQMNVYVTGVGYGFAGAAEVVPDHLAKAPLPPLVPFATVSGALPAGLAGPNSVVRFQPLDNKYETELVVPFVTDGRFSASVRAGRWHVIATDGDRRLAELPVDLRLTPGQVTKGVALQPPGAEPEKKPETSNGIEADQTGPWAAGTVRDETGRAISGASVYLVGVYNTGGRMYEAAAKATTNATGQYQIPGDAGTKLLSATLVASLPGKPPAWAWAQPPRPGTPAKDLPAKAPPTDLLIPAKGGTLDITVRQQNQPATGVCVIAWLEGSDLLDVWGAASASPERREVEAIVHPIKTVDRNGVAHFDNLLPGQYRIVAAVGDVDHVRDIQDSSLWETPDPYAVAEGIPVRQGSITAYRMNIFPQGLHVPMQITRGDGKPLTNSTVFDYTSSAVGEWGRTVDFKPGNILTGRFESPGLRRISFKYRDSGIGTMHVGEEPYYQASGMIGASHLLELKAKVPAKFTAMRFEPGSLVVELRDTSGQRTRGVIEIEETSGRCAFAGSTDASGTVHFEGIQSGQYILRTYPSNEQRIDLGAGESPLPTPDQLKGKTATLSQRIDVIPNTEKLISLRADLVGYITGSVKPPAGHTPAEYSLLASTSNDAIIPFRYRPNTGDFVAGPFPAGKAKLIVLPAGNHSDDQLECASQDLTIDAGKVAQINLNAKAPADAALPASATAPEARLPWRGPAIHLAGRVLMHDGKTPALAARVMLLGPPDAEPIMSGLTDALGVIHARRMPRFERQTTGDMKEPIVIAYLPGSCGSIIKPVPREGAQGLELILPAAVTLKGKVTLAGLPIPGRDEKIRVMAGYQGKGVLNDILSVQTIAQPDGTFEIAGLTPGTYLVQAAMDDLWLSESATVTIADTPPAPVALNIGTPGGPLTVRIVGNGGKPVKARQVVIDRPKGPLNTLLWPAQWLTDGAGEVWIPALEAGQHTVRVPRTTRTGEASVPGLPVDSAVALQIQIDEKTNP